MPPQIRPVRKPCNSAADKAIPAVFNC